MVFRLLYTVRGTEQRLGAKLRKQFRFDDGSQLNFEHAGLQGWHFVATPYFFIVLCLCGALGCRA